jgi:hypothetical protein
MTTWAMYLKNSLGVRIFSGVCLVLVATIIITVILEKKRLSTGMAKGSYDNKVLIIIRRICIGAIIGFVVSVTAGVAQFIIRFGYFSLLQEIGVVMLGFVGAIIGALCGIIIRRK